MERRHHASAADDPADFVPSPWPAVAVLALTLAATSLTWSCAQGDPPSGLREGALGPALAAQGKTIFRVDPFGDDTFWTDALRLHGCLQQSRTSR